MTKELMIKAIYEKIADKTLSFGCSVFIQNYITSVIICGDNRGLTISEGTEYEEFIGQCGNHTQTFKEKHITKIIGHPVMIGDVLDYMENLDYLISNEDKIFFLLDWEYKRKPIEEQSSECIELVYNLIK